jgi:exonuclease SbcC
LNERIEKNQNKSIELTDKIQTLQTKIKSDEDKIETKNLELTKQNILLTIVKEAIEEIKIIDSRIDRANTGISTFETGLTDEKMLEEELQSILSHIENFKKLSLEKSNLERDAANIKSRMKDNEEASSLLGKGYCPFLEEECGNLKKGSSPDEFFRIKDIHFNEELNNILTKIKEIGNPEQEQSLFENAVGNLEQKINKNNSDRMSINKLINDRKAFMLERDNSIKDFQIILLKNNYGIRFESGDLDMSTIEIDTRKIIDEFNMEISSLKATNVADKKAEKDLTTQINNSNVEIRDWNFQVNNFANQNNDISTKLSSLEVRLNNLNEQLKPYSALKVQLETINNKLNSLKPAYDAYLQNKKMADSIPSIEKEISGIKEQMQNLENEIKDYKDRISNLNLTFSQQELDIINEKIKEQTTENENFHLRIGTIEAEIKNLKREIAENNNQVIEIDNLKKSVAKLERKKSMTIVFRQNLRDMGKMVAARKLNGIAETATVNYQNISGKSEVIQWINDESNTYQVLLKDRSQLSKPRKFEMLSGGEQVTVAIAIRSAIASTMTHSNLAIFDEPTINLDSERRLALADSLKTMLEKLEQAIIVTHDDTFREMAQKTIELP